MDDYTVGVLTNIGLFGFIALSAYLLLLGGEMSFGQQAFFGVGAYTAGMLTVMGGVPLLLAVLGAMLAGALAALLVALPTLRLRGLYFAMASLCAAEAVRIGLEMLRWQIVVDGEPVGPDGSQGFRGIRWVFENAIDPLGYLAITWGALVLVLVVLIAFGRSRAGVVLRAVGLDAQLAAVLGVRVVAIKLAVAAAAGAVAAIGGALFAHHNTYVEPRNFDIMLGVHAIAYAMIGGLGTALGPLLGVVIDIGLLEASRVFQGWRMIVFGGLVAVLLAWRPRGLLDETLLHRLGQRIRRPRAGVSASPPEKRP